MKLLLDQNLSPRLIRLLRDSFPDSAHVSEMDLSEADDRRIWQYAREKDYLIVTRDSDFMELSMMLGAPPKVIWIRRGNCPTLDVLEILQSGLDAIQSFDINPAARVLILR